MKPLHRALMGMVLGLPLAASSQVFESTTAITTTTTTLAPRAQPGMPVAGMATPGGVPQTMQQAAPPTAQVPPSGPPGSEPPPVARVPSGSTTPGTASASASPNTAAPGAAPRSAPPVAQSTPRLSNSAGGGSEAAASGGSAVVLVPAGKPPASIMGQAAPNRSTRRADAADQ